MYASTIADLHQKLAEFQKEAWKHMPPGYEENNCFPLLTINQGNGVHHPTKWIKLLDNCTVLAFTADDSPGSTPHIYHIYAQPTMGNQPVEPLPAWFEALIIGPMPQYHTLYKGAPKLNDWGISADITRICDYDTLKREASAKICKWEACLASFTSAHCLAWGHLEAARVSYRHRNFNHLGSICKCGQFVRHGQVSPIAHGRANVAGG